MWFPTVDEVMEMHRQAIERAGGSHGVLNPGGIEAALHRAEWGPFRGRGDVFERAALLLRGIAQDHPFADGNKRTAFEATDTFLRRNRTEIDAEHPSVVAFMVAVARGERDAHGIETWLRENSRKL